MKSRLSVMLHDTTSSLGIAALRVLRCAVVFVSKERPDKRGAYTSHRYKQAMLRGRDIWEAKRLHWQVELLQPSK